MYKVIGGDGQEYGPVNSDQIQMWLSQGRLTLDSTVIDMVSGQRMAVRSLPGLTYQQPQYPPPGFQQPNVGTTQPIYASYNRYPQTGAPATKSKAIAAVLAFFLGSLGIHRFYLGHNDTAVIMLLCGTVGWFFCIPGIVVSIWAIVDMINILAGNLTDVSGAPLT